VYGREFQRLEIEIPRVADDWLFELEYSAPDSTRCDFSAPPSGRYEDLWSDEAWVLAYVRCGLPLEDVELTDPGFAACLSDLADPPAHAGLLYSLDCSGRGIEDLDGIDRLWALNDLDLSENALSSYDPFEDGWLPSIQRIDLSHNRIETVELDGWGAESIDLSHNLISTVGPLEAFLAQSLVLRHNRIESFEIEPWDPEGQYWRSVEIQQLDLAHNRLTELDLSLIASYLWMLDVSHNELETLNLRSPSREDDRYLYFLPFDSLDASFNRLGDEVAGEPPSGLVMPETGISEIDLTDNALTLIPPAIASAGTRELVVARNEIDSVDLSDAEELRLLDLSDNALDAIDLSSATRLSDVDLSGNEIDDFAWPDATVPLETIDLSRNPLSALNGCVGSWLWWLRAENANVEFIDVSGCHSLEVIELAGNALTTLDVTGNGEVEYIDLRENPLTCEAIDDLGTNAPGAELLYDEPVCAP